MANDDKEDDELKPYKVGYRRPPREHQFKPGKSGNSQGRPKKSKNLHTLLENELDRLIVVKEQGRERRMPKREAIVKRLATSALNGDHRALDLLFKSGRANPPPEPIQFDISADDDLDQYLRRYARAHQKDVANDSEEADIEENPSDDDL